MQQYFASQNQFSSNQIILASISSVETPSLQDPASITTERPHKTLRAEKVGFFDPQYQQEQGNTSGGHNKYLYYRDVFVFVDRLKALAKKNNVKSVISECLRGTALM